MPLFKCFLLLNIVVHLIKLIIYFKDKTVQIIISLQETSCRSYYWRCYRPYRSGCCDIHTHIVFWQTDSVLSYPDSEVFRQITASEVIKIDITALVTYTSYIHRSTQ